MVKSGMNINKMPIKSKNKTKLTAKTRGIYFSKNFTEGSIAQVIINATKSIMAISAIFDKNIKTNISIIAKIMFL